jgi:hypothetical protein
MPKAQSLQVLKGLLSSDKSLLESLEDTAQNTWCRAFSDNCFVYLEFTKKPKKQRTFLSKTRKKSSLHASIYADWRLFHS